MHVDLEAALQRLRLHFRSDDRCLAMYVTGSLGKQCADEFSDIDVAIVVAREHYASLKSEMRDTCEALCGKIAAWLPEGEQSGFVNYAFLFESGDHLLLCDLMVVTTAYQSSASALKSNQVIFDKAGALRVEAPEFLAPRYTAADLSMTLRTYWIYAYLDGKYYRRGDLYKMLYVQYALFLQHVNLFRAFNPDLEWGWWARDVQHLSEDQRKDLLIYFGVADALGVRNAFQRALDLFSRDAQSAYRVWNMDYPLAMETAVRTHLKQFGVLN